MRLPVAEVAELADATDSKSVSRKGVGVRIPPSAPFMRYSSVIMELSVHSVRPS